MARPATDKRERILATATAVIYARGFHQSSLADIARQAGVPVGSIYYFFKTKDDLGRGVIDSQFALYSAMRAGWDAQETPAERLVAFLGMTAQNQCQLAQFGCPVGTLCGELQKEGGDLGAHASGVFAMLLAWLTEQFVQLGAGEDSVGHAEHLLGAIEGAALLAHSFSDPTHVQRSVARLTRWIYSLEVT